MPLPGPLPPPGQPASDEADVGASEEPGAGVLEPPLCVPGSVVPLPAPLPPLPFSGGAAGGADPPALGDAGGAGGDDGPGVPAPEPFDAPGPTGGVGFGLAAGGFGLAAGGVGLGFGAAFGVSGFGAGFAAGGVDAFGAPAGAPPGEEAVPPEGVPAEALAPAPA